ncbi:MAG: glutaredoxin domain-containing protein [Alcanivoracaceae bacterium]
MLDLSAGGYSGGTMIRERGMPRVLLWLLVLMSVLVRAEAFAQPPVLQVFEREGCPHCEAAKHYLKSFAAERPELQIHYRAVDRDPLAQMDMVRYAEQAGIWPPGVPMFVYNGKVLLGFDSAGRSGPALAALIGEAGPAAVERDLIDTGVFGALRVSELGLPLFTLAIGLIDGFNPCAMYVLLFLLSMLVHLKDRLRMALIAGTFVLVSGAVYYAFMAAWLNIFLAVGLSTPIRVALALMALVIGLFNVKDYVIGLRGFSFSIPEAAKPGLHARVRRIIQARSLPLALAGVTVLAVLVNIIELLCTAGLPAMYTAILTQQELSPTGYYAYLGLYIVGYMADDALMVTLAVVALSSGKLTERAGRGLKLVSGLVMLLLGLVMLLKPEWLV